MVPKFTKYVDAETIVLFKIAFLKAAKFVNPHFNHLPDDFLWPVLKHKFEEFLAENNIEEKTSS